MFSRYERSLPIAADQLSSLTCSFHAPRPNWSRPQTKLTRKSCVSSKSAFGQPHDHEVPDIWIQRILLKTTTMGFPYGSCSGLGLVIVAQGKSALRTHFGHRTCQVESGHFNFGPLRLLRATLMSAEFKKTSFNVLIETRCQGFALFYYTV